MYKLLNDSEKAEKWYKDLCKILFKLEKVQVVKYTIGLLLIPTTNNRRHVEKFVENLHDILQLYTFEEEEEGITQYYDFKMKVWRHRCETKIVEYLSKVAFFHRFSEKQLRTILPLMKLKIYNKDDVLFTARKYVYVIIHGDVVLKQHKLQAFPFKLMACYKQGGIIGSDYEHKSNR